MSANELYRVEVRVQSGQKRYYLVREVNTDAKKFAATRLIKSGTKPTRAEITRCTGLYGFDLEMKCLAKVVKFRAKKYSFEKFADDNEYFELERFRYLVGLLARRTTGQDMVAYISEIARLANVEFTPAEITRMLSSGEIPRGKLLSGVNVVQNLKNAYQTRAKKEHLTSGRVMKIRSVLLQNLDITPFSPEDNRILTGLISSFNEKIKEKYHPFEQCVLFYEKFMESFPSEVLLAAEIYSRMTTGFGYPVIIGKWEDIIGWVKEQNTVLELEVRHSFSEMTKGKTGVRQKQLDFFE
ncbi:MAG: hypothetical protein M0P20_01310 [Methanocorpusculum sp.]|jgi:hypothetical protein|nr:hypothetical protein [Methanocorpusculum sp.]MDD3256737.1 hypothetical protein [Methanocorpusculum sp.]